MPTYFRCSCFTLLIHRADPSGLKSAEIDTQLLSSCRKLSCSEKDPQKSETAVCFPCSVDRAAIAPQQPTPFVSAAAVSKEVFSAFQRHDVPSPPGSVFRNQDTIIETSSSDDAQVLTPDTSIPRLNGTLSTPMERGFSCGVDLVGPPQLSFQRQSSACLGAVGSCPAHGVKAVCGKRNKMEDMYAVQPNFCDIPLSPTMDEPLQNKLPTRIAVQLENTESPTTSAPLSPSVAPLSVGSGGGSGHGPTTDADPSGNSSFGTSSDAVGASDTLHFFGVYDGHGGCQAAEHCAKRLHHHLSKSIATACGYSIADGNQLLQAREADSNQVDWSISSSLMQSVTKLACLTLGSQDATAVASSSPTQIVAHGAQTRDKPHSLLAKASVDSDSSNGSGGDEHALYTHAENDAMFENDSSGSSGSDRSDGVSVTCLLEEALKEAFVKTDAEFANDGCAAMVGSTALVALVGTRKVWLANCGKADMFSYGA